ncbi:hypothetical protein ALC62_11821 [Cyphomyrmex costatus]|uniref:Uncharacterized protein n=1 Tax=Cyphomyrmex costatus TaxID=456900 RepID=A0A195C9N1_9HYME|nr:hypothetical protein ALC62_11821 [Cyphomyrmex costatus]
MCPIGELLAYAKIDVPSEMLFERQRKLLPEMSALLNSGRVLAHPVLPARPKLSDAMGKLPRARDKVTFALPFVRREEFLLSKA